MFDAIASGRVVRPAKMSTTRTGKAMANLLLAVRAEQHDDTVLLACVGFEKTAEAMAALEKGDAITAVGPIRPTQWETGDGDTRHGVGMTVVRLTTPYIRRKTAERTDPTRKPGKGKKSHAWADLYGCGDIELEEDLD